MKTIELQELTFTLRPWQLSDVPSLVKYANNKKIADNMRDMFPHPYTADAGAKFIEWVSKDNPLKVFAIVINNEACGSIGVFPMEDISRLNAELGYWLAEEYWGKGIISAAVKEMIQYGFETFPIKRIFAIPFVHNKASQRIVEKAGMKLEAVIKDALIKNGVVQDEQIYAIRKS